MDLIEPERVEQHFEQQAPQEPSQSPSTLFSYIGPTANSSLISPNKLPSAVRRAQGGELGPGEATPIIARAASDDDAGRQLRKSRRSPLWSAGVALRHQLRVPYVNRAALQVFRDVVEIASETLQHFCVALCKPARKPPGAFCLFSIVTGLLHTERTSSRTKGARRLTSGWVRMTICETVRLAAIKFLRRPLGHEMRPTTCPTCSRSASQKRKNGRDARYRSSATFLQ